MNLATITGIFQNRYHEGYSLYNELQIFSKREFPTVSPDFPVPKIPSLLYSNLFIMFKNVSGLVSDNKSALLKSIQLTLKKILKKF